MEKKWIAISVIVVIMCACVVMSISVIKVAYTVKEPYSTTETYYVTEPYQEIVKEPIYEDYHESARLVGAKGEWGWEEIVPLSYTVMFSDVNLGEPYPVSLGTLITLRATVINNDNRGGWFSVIFCSIPSPGCEVCTSPPTGYVGSGERRIFDSEVRLDEIGVEPTLSCGVKVVAIEKTITKYHDVPKQRTVTKYRDVTKYKYISALEISYGRRNLVFGNAKHSNELGME